MKDYFEVENIVKNKLTEKRFYHSICTMNRAVEYAKIYGIDEEKAKLVGIAHDIAKKLNEEEIDLYIKKYNIELDAMESKSLALSHSKIGAAIAKEEFGFNEEMVNAIAYHTTGKENMSMLEKIIFVADFTGDDRQLECSKKVYELAKVDLDLAIIKILKETIKYILEENKAMHLNTINAYNFYIENNKNLM